MGIFAYFAARCPLHQDGRSSGNFSSPGYPSNYPNNQICTWRITVPGDYGIRLVFDEFVTGDADFLRIYDGASSSSNVLANLRGRHPSGFVYVSTGSSLWFQFTTDYSFTRKGFHATYTTTQRASMYRLDSQFNYNSCNFCKVFHMLQTISLRARF